MHGVYFFSGEKGIASENYKLSIMVYSNSAGLTSREYWESIIYPEESEAGYYVYQGDFPISGVYAEVYLSCLYTSEFEYIWYIFSKDYKIFSIGGLTPDRKNIEQILSTFKFLE